MNKISKYTVPALIAFVMISLTSCLKDKGAEAGTYGMTGFEGGVFVSAPDAARNPIGLALESKSGNQTINLFSVNYENVDKAPEDIKVTFAKDDAAVATVSGLTLLPSSVLTFSAGEPSVTILKGNRISPAFQCQINTGTLDPTKSYGLAFTIKSVSKAGVGIPANLKTVIYKISLKNKYHGTYKSTGYFYHPSSPRALSATKSIVTYGPNSVIADLGDLGGSGYQALIEIDPVTNKLTISAAPGAAGGPYTQMDASLPATNPGYTAGWTGSSKCTNVYDPATKTFYVRYGYMGGTGWRVTEEHLVLQ